MNSTSSPSTVRAIWIIGRLAIRRQLNLWQSVRLARKRKRAQAKRSGTPGKSGGRSFFGSFVFLLMVTNGFLVGSRGLTSLSATSQNIAESTDKIVVSAYTQVKLVEAEKALHQLDQFADLAERNRYRGMWNRFVDQLFVSETRWGSFTEDEENVRLHQMHRVFAKKGAAGFTSAHRLTLSVSATTWPRMGEAKSTFLGSLSLLVTLWIPIIVFVSLGTNNKDLGQVEWSFEWLYTFPVSARALFASKIFVYSFLNPLPWAFFFPFIVLIYVASGFGFAALGLGFAVMVYLALLAGAITAVVEVALRKFLTLGQLKNVQALFTVLGTFALLLFYATALSRPIDAFLVHKAASMPALLIWNPFSLPLILGIPAAPTWQLQLGVIGMIMGILAAGSLALLGSEWLTQDGLVKAGGPYQSVRKPAATAWRRSLLRGIVAQEMRLLARDRNLLAQVLIIPLLVPAYYLLTNSGMMSAITGNFRRAAMVAFAIGAYSYLNSALMLLSREDKTLWHLLSFPRSLTSILLKKTAVWAAVGVLYGSTVLFVLVRSSPHLHASSTGDVFLALYGIVLYAFIGSGIGILATDVLEPERSARIRIDMVYLYMVLAAMYANTFYTLSVWTKSAQLVLSTLLAFALWQKVKDLSPYLLDPAERPPRTIGLADGMIAALAFFVAQAVAMMVFQGSSTTSLTVQITIAYIAAGVVVAFAVLCTLWRQGVPDLWQKIGFLPGADEGRGLLSPRQGVMQGAIWGAAAALGAFVYLYVLGLFPQWQVWRQDAELSSFLSRADQPLWICLLLVVAAPLVEEFLFRGLVFQGLRRSTGPLLAVLGSAALFALVHPPIAVIPVFGLGIATAISFERSRFLLAPVVAHAVYNGLVLFFNNL